MVQKKLKKNAMEPQNKLKKTAMVQKKFENICHPATLNPPTPHFFLFAVVIRKFLAKRLQHFFL